MSNLLYVGIAIAVSVIAIALLWLRNRRPHSLEAGIEQFQRELRALGAQQGQPQNPEQRDRRSAG